MADRPDSGILLFPNPATVRHLSAFSMANARDMWHEASALSCEICRGITAFGQQHPGTLATPFQAVVLAARRLAPSLLQIPFHDYFSDISYDTRRRYFQTAIRARALGYRPRRRLSEVELDGLRQLAACRTDMINFANALHGLTDDEKVRLFRHRPTMLEWYEKVAAVTDRVTDFLQSAQSANNYPAGTTDRPDKEDDA